MCGRELWHERRALAGLWAPDLAFGQPGDRWDQARSILLPVCSRKHHRTLKRQPTPAELKMARSLQPNCCAVISSDGKTFNARRRPGCCALPSDCKWNRLLHATSSDARDRIPRARARQITMSAMLRFETALTRGTSMRRRCLRPRQRFDVCRHRMRIFGVYAERRHGRQRTRTVRTHAGLQERLELRVGPAFG
jgi:hypothetical protein